MQYLLRALLGAIGLTIVFLGLNIGLGGIHTLGWQGAGDFIAIVDSHIFMIRDNHVRFIGGVWLGVGLVFLASAFLLSQLKMTILILFGIIVVGGVARLSTMDATLLTSPDIMPSLIAELIVFPLIGLWVWKQERSHD